MSLLVLFNQGSAGPWTPTQLGSAVKLWLDAQASSNILHTSGAVNFWYDQQASPLIFQQGTAANKPTYSATGWDGTRPQVAFDGIDDFLEQNNNFAPVTAPFWIFAVWKDWTAGHMVHDFFGVKAGLSRNAFNVFADGAYGGATSSGKHITGALFNGATSQVWLDGTNATTVATGSGNDFGANTAMRIGQSGGTSFGNMKLAELIVVSGAMSTLDRQKMEGYLAERWGIKSVLPSGHPYGQGKYHGAKTRANRYLGTRADAVLNLGVTPMGWT